MPGKSSIKDKGGRPTKYKPEMCKTVIELMSDGCSLAEVAKELEITRETLNKWRKEKPDFSDAVTKGIGYSQAWWEKKGRTNLESKVFQSRLWALNMKNRFPADWKDRREHTIEPGENGGKWLVEFVNKKD